MTSIYGQLGLRSGLKLGNDSIDEVEEFTYWEFIYWGSVVSSTGDTDHDVDCRSKTGKS